MKRVKATDADYAFFWQLNKLSYKDLVIRQFGEWDESFQMNSYQEKWKEQQFDKIIIDGAVAGGIWVIPFEDHHYIREIQIVPEFRDRGIGTKVLQQEISRGKEIRLRVLLRNRAISLYERLGFVVTHADDTHRYMTRQIV